MLSFTKFILLTYISSAVSSSYFETYYIEPNRHGRNAVNLKQYKWPKGVVYYLFDGDYKTGDRSAVLNAMLLIVEKTCVQFLPKSASQDEHIRFVKVWPGLFQFTFCEISFTFISLEMVNVAQILVTAQCEANR